MKPKSPPNPATKAARRSRNAAAAKSVHGSAPSSAAPHVVGDAASAAPGTGTDTAASSDWLEERVVEPDAQAQDGVPASTDSTRGMRRGKAVESKRGQQ